MNLEKIVEERMDKGMDEKEKQSGMKIGGRIASGGHCCLQRNVLHEL